MRKLLGTIALAALATATVHADPGGQRGHGSGNGGGNGGGSATAESRGGSGNGGGAPDRGGGGGPGRWQGREAAPGRAPGGGPGPGRGQGGGNIDRVQATPMREQHGNANRDQAGHGRSVTVNRPVERAVTQHQTNGHADHGRNAETRVMPAQAHNQGRAADQRRVEGGTVNNGELVRGNGPASTRVSLRDFDRRGLVNGCPPGLAKKNNGCMPPGLARQNTFDRYDANWWGLRGLTSTSDYRYYDGSLVRLAPTGAILSYYPLLGGMLSVGNYWPSFWEPTPLWPYYSDYYGFGDDYRYFDGVIYIVDPGTDAIETIAVLLTGDSFVVGQRIPYGYDVYNVPYPYRDRYFDGPDAYYRYSDGYIYRVSPRTHLILAVIELRV